MKTLQCVPNFSEGRDPNFLRELQTVLARHPVKVLDLSMNKDHNRADATFLGAPEAVETAAMLTNSTRLGETPGLSPKAIHRIMEYALLKGGKCSV